jgi:hypothetical protein
MKRPTPAKSGKKSLRGCIKKGKVLHLALVWRWAVRKPRESLSEAGETSLKRSKGNEWQKNKRKEKAAWNEKIHMFNLSGGNNGTLCADNGTRHGRR